jgi:hypothetical protein
MNRRFALIFATLVAPLSVFAREGTPSYYNNNRGSGQYYQGAATQQPYTNPNVYVGNQGTRPIVGQQSYSYQVPRQNNPLLNGTMTPNGINAPIDNNPYDLVVSADYTRRFADFQFETGVQSVLEWDDMIVNEIGFKVEKDFNLRGYDMFAYGQYAYGKMSSGGLSMDYDLKPYDDAKPTSGIFTVSLGDQSGSMQDMKIGIGMRNAWDINGWKISPSVGYQIFEHDLQMSNHIYPNPAVYIPLMNQYGDYIYGDTAGNYYSVPQGTTVQDDWYQVCLSPEDLALAQSDPSTHAPILVDTDGDGTADSLQTTSYDPLYEYLPWGVGSGECVVVGGDGVIKVEGTTHIYNTTWSGLFVGLELEKQMTYTDKLRFYGQVSMPHYKAEGIWPNRTDWQQNPSFIDEGDTGAMHYQAEMEYLYQFNDRLQLSLKVDMTYFHIGAVGGELYVAGYQYYATDEDGNLIYDDTNNSGVAGDAGDAPRLLTQDPYTEKVSDSLKNATWQSFGLHFGVKYAF